MSDRLAVVHLTNPAHKLPMPGAGGRLFPADDAGEQIDTWDPFWIGCLKDRSVTLGPRKPPTPAEPPQPEAPAVSAPPPAATKP